MEDRVQFGNSPIIGGIMSLIDALGDLIARPVYGASVTNPRLGDRHNEALWRKAKPVLYIIMVMIFYVAVLGTFFLILVDLSALRTPRSCAEQVANARGSSRIHSHTAESLLLYSQHVEIPPACTARGHTGFIDDSNAIARMKEACRRVTTAELEAGLIILDPYSAHAAGSVLQGDDKHDSIDTMYEHSYVTIDDAVVLNEELLRRSQGVDFMAPKFWKRPGSFLFAGAPLSDSQCPLDRYDDTFNPCMISVRIGVGAGHILTLINPVVVDALMEKPHSHASHNYSPPTLSNTAASAAHALEAMRAARPSASEILVAEFTEPTDIYYPLRISEVIYSEPTISAVDARECMTGGDGNVSTVARRINNWRTGVVLQLATAAVGDAHFMDRGEIMDDPEHDGVVNIVTQMTE